MQYRILFTALVAITFVLTSSNALGQSGQELAASLRTQLSELETKQATLQTRLQELEAKLKSENIEQSLAGVGSTRPEDLREQQRRGLEIERNGVQKQLELLAASRTRLETSLARADANAYRESAAPQIVTTQPVAPQTNAAQNVSAETSPGVASDDAVIAPAPRRRSRRKRIRRARRTHHMQTSLVVISKSRLQAGLLTSRM